MPTYLVFDVVGTLIHPAIPVATTYRKHGWQCGSQYSEEEIAVRFQQAFHHLFLSINPTAEHGFETPPTSDHDQQRRWRKLVANVFDDIGSTDQLFKQLWDHFSLPSSWNVFEDVGRNWNRLESSGIELCLGSNFDSRLFSIVEGLSPLDRINHVFCSGQLGFEKPDRRFFTAIEARLQPARFVMIGDHRQNDYLAPMNSGWDAILIDRSDRRGFEGSIKSFDELDLGRWQPE